MVHELEVCLFAERANRAGVRDGFVYFDYSFIAIILLLTTNALSEAPRRPP